MTATATVAQPLAVTADFPCPRCQVVSFPSQQKRAAHLRWCGKPRGVSRAPKPAPEAELATVPAFVQQVVAPPPPPPPQDEVPQYVGRMPLPGEDPAHNPARLEDWSPPPVEAALPELQPEPEPESTAQAEASAGSEAPKAGTASAGEASAPAPEEERSPVDLVEVLAVWTGRICTWPRSGPLDEGEKGMLRSVLTWKPGRVTGFVMVMATVFGVRIWTHPFVQKVVDLFLGKIIAWIEGTPPPDKPTPAKAAVVDAEVVREPSPAPRKSEPEPPKPATPSDPWNLSPDEQAEAERMAAAAAGKG